MYLNITLYLLHTEYEAFAERYEGLLFAADGQCMVSSTCPDADALFSVSGS